ncbi:hypothetical protein I4F81_010692 [Pyropia yezoensis]|uniref:Uncharacterized protein n=1 Tax=Pyropia yezoensis TaxID=2788 RepID=A0ACC3CEB7_PYRYE|nr:hypothetical protein I4F81_010692 [Neopyropia yezoensis]
MVQPPPQRTLTVPTASTEADYGDHRNTAVWSLAASPSGASLTAGTGTCRVVTMDVESGAATFTGIGHTDDVNAVAYLHPGREDVMVSGADDGAVRLWDWRAGERSVGHFAGHVEGITSVGVRGDGRYLVSNGKDQAVKLWDVRTLIRARFSPPPTGGRWVAVGSADGAVVVYDILGDGVGRRLRWCGDPDENGEEEDECGGGGGRGGRRARTATPLVRLFRPRLLWAGGGGGVVRDVSWAPDGSALVGVGWDGGVCMWGARRGGSGLQSI